jgi:hypothetical protein
VSPPWLECIESFTPSHLAAQPAMRACAGLPDPASLHPSRPRSPASSANSSRIDECTMPSTPPPLESHRLVSNSGRPCSETGAGAEPGPKDFGLWAALRTPCTKPSSSEQQATWFATRSAAPNSKCSGTYAGAEPGPEDSEACPSRSVPGSPLGSQPAARPRNRSETETEIDQKRPEIVQRPKSFRNGN